jgi:16S rRNA (guanine966-N2)-methyltransferase
MNNLQGKVRIIGGRWRSRKITFPALPGLRPTADRIRETLFNWLAPYIQTTKCLDLFAGSGALGFEALSRGAASVTFVDHAAKVIESLQANAALLAATNAEFILGECPGNMPSLVNAPFDIVFLDPPFNQGLIEPAAKWLEDNQLLAKHALIYVETEINLSPLPVPANWQVLREKHTSSLYYYLLKRNTN